MKSKFLNNLLIGGLIIGSLFSFTGCGKKNKKSGTKEPKYFLSEDKLPEDTYYIVRTEKLTKKNIVGKKKVVKETRYYPLLKAENTIEDINTEPKGFSPKRLVWVNKDIDESQIPTMYAKDKLIYKSSKKIPTTYAMEKFFDNGYTLGVMGLTQDLSGNYRYYGKDDSTNKSATMSTSDAVGFDSLKGVESIYLAQVGNKRVTPLNVSPSGTITGLKKDKVYSCDVRKGTERIDAKLTCNIHYFSSAETYLFGSFSFVTPVIAQINVPDYVETGYFRINDGGFFRYVSDSDVSDYRKLKAENYNETIYTYDEDGVIDGTNINCIFDENGFLIPGTKEKNYSNKQSGLSYKDLMNRDKKKGKITHITEMKVKKGGKYEGIYRIDSISKLKEKGKKITYKIEATNEDNGESLDFKYVKTDSDTEVTTNKIYDITFKEAGHGFDGYEIVKAVEKEKETEEEKNIENMDNNEADTGESKADKDDD